jgi:hypothetical protein
MDLYNAFDWLIASGIVPEGVISVSYGLRLVDSAG